MNNWIKWRERTPGDHEYPIFAAWFGDPRPSVILIYTELKYPTRTPDVWMPLPLPKPPAKPTPEEIEMDNMMESWRRQGIDYAYDSWENIHAEWKAGWRAGVKWALSGLNAQPPK
jgi:hypothetical protein